MDDSLPHGNGSTKLERAARVLRGAILRGDLRPGQKLKQQELAERLEMSATPVREVLRVLVAEGLLEYVPYKGVFVAEISLVENEQIVPIRTALERLAVEMSVPRLSEREIAAIEALDARIVDAWHEMDLVEVRRFNYEFHSAIYGASGSPILCAMIEKVWPHFATNLLWMIPGRAEVSAAQHKAIVEAIRNRDATRAGVLMAEHIASAGAEVANFLRKQSQSRSPLTPARSGSEAVFYTVGSEAPIVQGSR
jgi:DNA-binding GntR family transcriptional regulator